MAQFTPVFKVAGITVPMPDNYSQVVSDLSSEESGRTLDGTMHKDVIAVKSSVPLEWSNMEWDTASALAKAVDGKTSVICEYIDVRNTYQMTAMTIYIGDRTFTPTTFTTDGKVYWKVSFSEIEV
ncbi:DUF6711 family protein [Anaerosacchariphilus polymeriproducens]|uniref:Phage tail protein n=1 Tax=Anaerosacchariphilus polymeriproducens TaxID=1812858 RepID=A0A371AQT6_9FIRM|nr:DUF6711 family protein [Anaerosacchariphilus polymeriproducens]RDU21943.1 hypothetical protein DWV06_15510 [Anaerosacchariphilus polymeriproducens]